jgi:hypothetical protein
MKTLGKKILFLGKKLHINTLEPMHVGFVLGLYNLLFIDFFALIAWVAPDDTPVWFYLLFVAPIAFLLMWLWAAQAIVHTYKKVALHDAVLIAKWSAWPFLAVAMLSAGLFIIGVQSPELSDTWRVMSYYVFLSSCGLLLANVAIVTFALRHPFMK